MAARKTKRCYLLQMTLLAAVLSLVRTTIPRRILLLGGNGMIGSAVAERLLEEGHHLTAVNRGNWRWGTDIVLKPRLKFIYCDRNFIEEECKGIFTSGVYDVAIDFSTYRKEQMQSILAALRQRVTQYVYISTDSVYEVSPRKEPRGSHSREEDAPGPEGAESVTFDEYYGREKLLGEHVLLQQTGSEDGLLSHALILRLPDVIGPRDRTLRWWSYQLWLQAHTLLHHPLHIPPHLEGVGMSFVHVDDIARLIAKVVANDDETLPKSGIFNLAAREMPTLREFLTQMGWCVGVREVEFAAGTLHLYPSVTRGPVNSTKAEEALGWSPSSLLSLMCEVCKFYTNATQDFPEELEMVVNYLSKLLADGSEEKARVVRSTLLEFALSRKSSQNVHILRKKEAVSYKTEL